MCINQYFSSFIFFGLFPQSVNENLQKYEEKCGQMQLLRGRLMQFADEQTKVDITNETADIQDRMLEAQRQYRTLLWSINQGPIPTPEK